MRQAPQEIIEPNEIPEEDEEEEEEKQSEQQEVSEDEEALKESTSSKPPRATRCEFNEVKLCSKNGAFLITKPKGTFIYYSTQNSRVKGEIAKQKLQI